MGGLSMYEISIRPWLYSLTQKHGKSITKLSEIPKQEFQEIADLGFDVVWMMGIWQLGSYGPNFDKNNKGLLERLVSESPDFTPDDIIGSPYAVASYTCNPELGTDADILAMRKTLNGLGLLLMLDYVPNHTAVDCPLTTSDKDNFVQAHKGTNPPFDSSRYLPNGVAYGWSGWDESWKDTAQINIWNPKTRALRTKEVLHVASLADGIRCDMAHLMLNSEFERVWSSHVTSWGYTWPATEWWADTITTVKGKFPNTIFLAEVYNPHEFTLQSLGFDFTYDKMLYDKLRGGNLDDIRGWIAGNSPSFASHSAHFVSNHDEERGPMAFGGWERSAAAALLSFTLPGMRFFWMGDFEGFKHKLAVHARRAAKEQVNQESVQFYKKLLSIINTPVFKKGEWKYVVPLGDSPLIGFHWSLGNERRLCCINYTDQQKGWGTFVLPDAQPQNGSDLVAVTDLMSGEVFQRSSEEMRTTGLHAGVKAWYASVFQY
eukprot:Phypoly_transcript_08086.p1 GENE.Phypoly_transcript_08086~~Phypoly_transcript_08086.p1  ORF type:complete len:517 (+),score=51.11 Phypoly_transcript_08086:88-1551(+)